MRAVAVFVALVLALAWIGWAPHLAAAEGCSPCAAPLWSASIVLAGVSPALAAFIAARSVHRHPGAVGTARPAIGMRERITCWALAVLLPAVTVLVSNGLAGVASVSTPHAVDGRSLLTYALLCIVANPLEEIGWRGFLQRRLQTRVPPALACVLVGLPWVAWHVPLFLLPGGLFSMASIPFVPWAVGLVARSITMGWLYNRSHEGVWTVSVFHVAMNLSAAAVGIGSYAVMMGVEIALAATVLAATRGRLGLQHAPAGAAPPRSVR